MVTSKFPDYPKRLSSARLALDLNAIWIHSLLFLYIFLTANMTLAKVQTINMNIF